MPTPKREIKILAFTRTGRSKQLQQVISKELATNNNVVDGPVDGSGVDLSYGLGDMLMSVFSIFCYVLDIVLEVRLALFYYASAVSAPNKLVIANNNTATACQLSEMPGNSSYMIWFYVTMAFIILPGIIGGLCSLSWHITDFRMRRKTGENISIFRYGIRFLFPLLLLGPVLHNIEAILFALAAKRSHRKQRKMYLYEQALFEDADAALLRIIECFLESLPQLVLQLHIVMASANFIPVLPVMASGDIRVLPLCASFPSHLKAVAIEKTDTVCGTVVFSFAELFPSLPLEIDCQLLLQFVTMAATLLGAAWALVSYQRTLRRFLFSHRQLPIFPSSFVLFLAHTFLLSGRVLAIVLFVQVLGWGALCGLLIIHSLVMFSWLQCGCVPSSKRRAQMPSGFCCSDSSIASCWFNIVLSLMYTSAYLNVYDTPSRSRYAFFFSVTLIENTCFLLSWFLLTINSPSSIAFATLVSILITNLTLVFGGVILLLFYYKFFHPNVFHSCSDQSGQLVIAMTTAN